MNSPDAAIFEDGPEDILSASLQSLYGLSPITFSTVGAIFTYPIKLSPNGHVPRSSLAQIKVATPETAPSNWSLHASSIWVSSLFIADHLEELRIDAVATGVVESSTPKTLHILELGAGAGLPSILLTSTHQNVFVTVSDYPDDCLIRTLSDNVRRNGVSERCRVVPYAWGADVGALLPSPSQNSHGGSVGSYDNAGFDIIFAADTLWNPELHAPLLDTLCMCLRRGSGSRIHLVAGLHTGRYTIQSFLDRTKERELVLEGAMEREVGGTYSRPWDVSRAEGEDERERRRWVVWMILKWAEV